jgi:hypothetical protein
VALSVGEGQELLEFLVGLEDVSGADQLRRGVRVGDVPGKRIRRAAPRLDGQPDCIEAAGRPPGEHDPRPGGGECVRDAGPRCPLPAPVTSDPRPRRSIEVTAMQEFSRLAAGQAAGLEGMHRHGRVADPHAVDACRGTRRSEAHG